MGGKRRLKAAMPRRFKDHRTTDAKRWSAVYAAIAERYPPADALGRKLTAVAADLLCQYEDLQAAGKAARKRNASAARKTTGLLFGMLRVLASSNGSEPEEDLAQTLARLAREGS